VLKIARGVRPDWSCLRVQDLDAGWQLTDTPPGAWASPEQAPPADAGWLDVGEPGPVAALLRRLGDARLDRPGFRLDGQDWWFRVSFQPEGDQGAQGSLLPWALCLDGVATLAQAWLNGQPLALQPDMHLAQQLPVQHLLRDGANDLWILCRALDPWLAQRRPRPRWRAPMIEHQQLRWVRTTLLGRTPGWSPSTPVVGPWRWLGLVQIDAGAPEVLDWVADWQDDGAQLRLRCLLPTATSGSMSAVAHDQAGTRVELALQSLDGAVLGQWPMQAEATADGEAKVAWFLDTAVPQAQAWWPHTHGSPQRYALVLTVTGAHGASRSYPLGATGFRRVEAFTAHEGFEVRVNGVPVFCRGACWTPMDIEALDAASAADYDQALTQVCDAGLNMLRVGGTMAYEADAFYDACDAQGVLVWQDLMFANMDYPEDAAFVDLVAQEVTQQLRRWQGRPCLAVVCGNSEVSQQAAMFGALRELWSPALFERSLRELVEARAPGLPYWPSSAHGGAFPHQNDRGTTSYYGVGAYQRPPEDARRSGLSFATECLAFANLPEADGLAEMPGGLALRSHHPAWKAGSPRDLGAGWDFEDVRDHYVSRLYGQDTARLRYSDHDRYLALGRAAVADVVAGAMAEWRRAGSTCHGALVWFWRDLRPGAGWGVLDSAGRPKSPYHALKRACQPRSVSFTDESGNGMRLHLVNERSEAVRGTLVLTAWKDGETQVAKAERSVEVAAREVRALDWADSFAWFADWSWFYRFGPLGANVLQAVWRDEAGQVISQALALPGGADLRQELDLGLSASVVAQDEHRLRVAVHTRRLAQGVHWDVSGWVASDNHFHLAPGQQAEVVFTRHPGSARKPFAGAVQALNAIMPVGIRPLDA
jgi:beta-mannosidase